MLRRYVLARLDSEDHPAIDDARAAVARYREEGVRAVGTFSSSDHFSVLMSVQGGTPEQLDAAAGAVVGAATSSTTITVCQGLPCELLIGALGAANPSWLPWRWEEFVFLTVELRVPPHETDLDSWPLLGCAGRAAAVDEGGEVMLVELADEVAGTVEADIEALRSHPDVAAVHVHRMAAAAMQRARP